MKMNCWLSIWHILPILLLSGSVFLTQSGPTITIRSINKQSFIECLDKYKTSASVSKQLKILAIKHGLFPEYIHQVILQKFYDDHPPDGTFFGFIKNMDRLNYKRYFPRPEYIPKFGIDKARDFINRFQGKIAIYNHAYANGFGEFCINNYVIRPPFDSAPSEIRAFNEGPIVFWCKKACVFGNSWIFNLGHFIHDYLSPMALIPDDYLEDCVVILSHQVKKYGEDVLKAVGVRKYLYLTEREWVYADKLAVAIEGRPHNIHYGQCMKRVVENLRYYYQTHTIKGTRYAIMNRASNDRRHIKNIQDLINAVKTNIKEVSFEEITDKLGSIESYAKFYPSLKCVFLPTGSNAFKGIFMHPNSVIIIAANEMYDVAAVYTTLCASLKVIYIVHPNFHHDNFNVDVDLAVQAIKVGVTTSITGEFPKPIPGVSFIDKIQ